MHKSTIASLGLLLISRVAPALAGALLIPSVAGAQAPPPPPPPPPPPSSGADQPASESGWDASSEAAPFEEVTLESDSVEPEPAYDEPAYDDDPPDDPEVTAETEAEETARRWHRAEQHRAYGSLRASTGLLRVSEAGSGPVGSFRVGVYGGLYSGNGFLCTDRAPCFDRATGQRLVGDDVSRMAASLTLSATPFSFLEAFLGFHNVATSNSLGRPELLQVLGDANLGVKLFTPAELDEIFSFGGEAALILMNGTGGVGLDGGSTGFSLRALGTLDLNRFRDPRDRLPLRAHLNLGYLLNNSARIVEQLENTAPPDGRGAPIERFERFGLGISRLDSFQIGLGAEYLTELFRPFIEWSIDVPVNRQKYVCSIEGAASRGDRCLGAAGQFNTMPSRISVGTRVSPWQGLGFTAAVDLATGGSSWFLEETTPELPYTVWLGVSYAVDTQPEPIVERVEVCRDTGERRYVVGTVVDTEGNPISGALLHYEGRELTGMVTDAQGRFRTTDLPPDHYTFIVSAEGYKTAECEVTVLESVEDAADPAYPPEEAPYINAAGDLAVPVTCQLEVLPKVATITGAVVDGATGQPVGRANVRVVDKLGRELSLTADERGAFQFRNVPFGRATVTIQGTGYLPTVVHFDIDSRKEIEALLSLNERPAEPNVQVTDKELKLKRQVHFLHGSADLLPDSMALIEEIAEALLEHPEIRRVEIQGHTDNSGQADYNRQLSQQRAEAVQMALIQLGVEEDRLRARGYGPDKPLVPNTSEPNRSRNRRVQLIVQERSPTF